MELSDFKKIIIVHDSFTQLGGAERIVSEFLKIFPTADLYALVADSKILNAVTDKPCHTSYLASLYDLGMPFKHLLPLIPPAVESWVFPEKSLIISSSSLFLKGLILPKDSMHIQYLHTPPRFLWTDPLYVKQEVSPFIRPFVNLYLKQLKKWDLAKSKTVTQFIVNSKEVQRRVKKFYNRESLVVYPFVDTDFWKKTQEKSDFFLMGGRLQEHKNYEVIINAFAKNKLPLKVFGSGRFQEGLKDIAGSNVEFLGRVSDNELRDLYSQALGFIYPSLEDFGIMPLEASACGTPTLAFGHGGALETIVAGKTGEFYFSQDISEINSLLNNWNFKKYLPEDLKMQADKFSKEVFLKTFTDTLNKYLKETS